MKTIFYRTSFFIISLIGFSCFLPKEEKSFFIKHIYLKEASIITKTIYFKGHFFSITTDHRLIILNDTTNTYNLPLYEKLNTIRPKDLIVKNDSLFALDINDSTFKLNHFRTWEKKSIDFDTNIIFEDEKYKVEKTCSGEWGGSAFFINKATNKKFGCSATCPIIINKSRDGYFLTASLAHGSGWSTVLKIGNPDSFQEVTATMPSKKKIVYVGDNEIKTTKGAKTLLDSGGIMIISSFLINEKIYNIVTKHPNTFLTELSNGKLVVIDTFINKSLWSYDPVNTQSNNDIISNFHNDRIAGFIAVNNHSIKIFSNNEE